MGLWRGNVRPRLRRLAGLSQELLASHDATTTLPFARTLPAGRGGAAHYADA